MIELAGAVSVVTGAGRGIGLAIAKALAEAGGAVVLADFDADTVETAVQSLRDASLQCTAFVCDVRSDADMEALAAHAQQTHGHVDLLVNNAGVGLGGPVENIPIEEWEWIIEVNLLGIARSLRAFLPAMIARGRGQIVNVASSVALFGDSPFGIPYVTTKAGVMGLSRALRLYLEPKGLGVTLLCPDNTDTGFRQRAKVVGTDRATLVATLPKVAFQPSETVAAALLDGLRAGRFLVSLSPDPRSRLVAEAERMFQ